jgi:hypothetical protein
VFWKYLLWFLSFLTIVIFYLLNTSLGHYTIAQTLSSVLSKKTKNTLEVSSLNIDNYPNIRMNIKINNGATAFIDGIVNGKELDIDYHLVGDSFRYNAFKLNEKIDIKGHAWGQLSQPFIEGEGKLFEGEVAFSFIKTAKAFKNLKMALRNVNSEKVLLHLKKKPLLVGKADINAYFKYFSKHKSDGDALVYMKRATMPRVSGTVPFSFKSKMKFKDMEYFYDIGIKSDIGNMIVADGYYHKSKHESKANYAVDIKELSYFENFLKHKYRGGFQSEGAMSYYKKKLIVTGQSNKFGGLLKYKYVKEKIELNLYGVSLVKLLRFFSYPPLLSAKVYGSIDYHIKDKIVLMNTTLKEAKFRKTKMTDMIFNTTGIDMLKDTYDKSSFVGGYENSILSSTLKIDNGSDKHVYLTDTKMYSKTNAIQSKFEVKIVGEELYGDIYGTLKNPKVSIDMQKLLKYQLNKRLGEWLGTEQKEEITQKLNSVKEDVSKTLEKVDVESVKEKAKSFLNGFF